MLTYIYPDDIIVKKETFNNLLYGRESDLADEDRNIVNTWYTNGDIKVENDYYSYNSIVTNIINYKKIKTGAKITGELSDPLLYEMTKKNPYLSEMEQFSLDLKGKNICIDFVETEDGKDLYVNKVVDEKYIEDYALLNTNDIIFHYEAVKDVENMIDLIKSYGLKVGIAVNPDTNVEVLFPFLNKIDLVLIMSVYPGESGQLFIENS